MKIFTSRQLFVIALLTGSTSLSFADTFTVNGLQYETLSDETVQVKKYFDGTDVVIPSTVTDEDSQTTYSVVSVAAFAFRNAAAKTVTVAGSVRELEEFSFSRCMAESVVLEEGVENLGFSAFSNCTNLQRISLPSTLKVMGDFSSTVGFSGSAFAFCSSLQEIDIPGSVGTVPPLTFQECYSLTKVKLAEGITFIDDRAFERCPITSIDFPSSLQGIGNSSFVETSLEKVHIPGTFNEVPFSAFLWCHSLMEIQLDEGIRIIGRQAFADCGPFTEINVPNSVTHIGTDAFQGNGAVRTIRLGSGVVAIGNAALAVWVPDQATNTPHWQLNDIYVDAVIPPDYDYTEEHLAELNADIFFGEASFKEEMRQEFFNSVKLHVPEESYEAYATHPIWGRFTDINGLTSAIGSISSDEADSPVEIYTITGVKVGSDIDPTTLDKGIYIMRSANSAKKVVIR